MAQSAIKLSSADARIRNGMTRFAIMLLDMCIAIRLWYTRARDAAPAENRPEVSPKQSMRTSMRVCLQHVWLFTVIDPTTAPAAGGTQAPLA